MQTRDIVVLGGSAGALSALLEIVRALPRRFPAALFVVIHTSPDNPGVLPNVLTKAGPLRAVHARDGDAIRAGQIYVAPPDHHLLVERGRVRVTRGPRENRFRPAVDPLFRTAARAYGPRVIGVILSGGQDDGVLGLSYIKRRGGIAVAQDPAEADAPSMPESAIRQVAVDHVLRAEDMSAIISGLVRVPIEEDIVAAEDEPARDIAEAGMDALDSGALPGAPSGFTCPECGGALWDLRDGDLVRFQCHVGHGFNGESLVAAQTDALEGALWTALRALEESSALRRRLARRASERGMTVIADAYEAHARDSEERAAVVRRILTTDRADQRVEVPSDADR